RKTCGDVRRREGVLEKRSDGLLQLWKKKALRPDRGRAPADPGQARIKELPFATMKTVDCVERKGKYVYFTVVMAEGKEVDFRCAQEQGWNAEITLQLVQYKNRQAILAVRSTRQKQQHLVLQQQQPQQPPMPGGGARLRSASNSA
uniref:Pleckstrin homology like domain family A member 1 n=1 Tax=Anolis carolinensis TaxID=28377 RepID=A0A803TRQ2_ANOCA